MENANEEFPDWIPSKIVNYYADAGIHKLFKWQRKILDKETDNDSNVVFSSPTSSGKSIVAELIALKVAQSGKKVLFVLPYISVAREKLHQIQKCWRRVDISVCGFIGPQATNPSEWFAAICTIEKASSLLNRALMEDWFAEIGLIVVDELHMIFDSSRGMHIEHMLTKIMFWNENFSQKIRIIGMSATIPQMESLGRWIDARTYKIDFRPIPIQENIVIEGKVMQINGDILSEHHREISEDPVVSLSVESFRNGSQTLIMCSSKIETEKISIMIAKKLNDLKTKDPALLKILKIRESGLIYTKMSLERIGCKDRSLISTMSWAIAFHHAGLTIEERECIEQAFREKNIILLAATSTLASGVNLPAERIIIKSQTRGPSAITSLSYKQMIGRAGRTGHATKGESYLVVRNSDAQNIRRIFEPIEQHFISRRSSDIRKFILEGVSTRLVRNRKSVKEMAGKLLNYDVEVVDDAIEYLETNSFISVEDEHLVATQLGSATISSALPPDAALSIFEDLNIASRSIALDTELHMLYLVTPINITVWHDCDWHHLFAIFSKISPAHRRVANLVGVSEKFLLDQMRGKRDENKLKTHVRFFSALALFDLINENSIYEVSVKYRISRGCLQTLQSQSATYAAMIVAFCLRLGWTYLKSLLDGFAMRLMFGIRSELSELVSVDGIDGQRARVLHEKGITCLSHLASCDEQKLAHYLSQAVPYSRCNLNDGKGEWLFGECRMKIGEAVELLKCRTKMMIHARLRELGISVDLSILMNRKPEKEFYDSGIAESCAESRFDDDRRDIIEECTQSMTEMSILSNSDDDSNLDCLETTFCKIKGPNNEKFRRRLSNTFLPSQSERFAEKLNKSLSIIGDDDSFDLPVRGSIPLSLTSGSRGSLTVQHSPVIKSCSNQGVLNDTDDSFDRAVPGATPYIRTSRRNSLLITILEQEQDRRDSLNLKSEIEYSSESILSPYGKDGNNTANSENRSFDIFESPPPKDESKTVFKHSRVKDITNSPLAAFVSSPVLKHGKWDEMQLQFEDICANREFWNEWLKNARAVSNISLAIDADCNGISISIPNSTVFIPLVEEYGGVQSDFIFPSLSPCQIPIADRIEALKMLCSISETYIYSLENAFLLFSKLRIQIKNANFLLTMAHANNLVNIEKTDTKNDLILSMMKQMELKYSNEYEKNKIMECGLAIESFVTQTVFEKLKEAAIGMNSESNVDLEILTAREILRMFYCGIEFDSVGCESAEELLKNQIEILEKECWRLAHGKFSIESSQQVANILFRRLGLVYPEIPSKSKKHLTTNKQILEQLRDQHEIVELILKYRHIRYTLTQCLQPLSKYKKRINCWFDTYTSTGRILTANPNIQNVPKCETLDGLCVRRLFRAKEGYILIAADYAQLELRVLAHWSGDPNLIDIIRNDRDLFKELSAKWNFSRDAIKQLCYGIIYGMGVKSLSELTRLTIEEANKLQRMFFEMFPRVRTYINETKEKAFSDGLIKTMLGKPRFTNKSIVGEERSREERVVVNYTIQGSASEIFKCAIVEIGKEIFDLDANIVMIIHDEIIVESAIGLEPRVTRIMRKCMEGSLSDVLRVPMKVKTKSGDTWADLK